MPDLATLIGYPSGHAPSTDSRHGCWALVLTARAEAAARGAAVGAGGGGGGGAGTGEGVAIRVGSFRRCSALHTANAAPLITASQKSRRSHLIIGATVARTAVGGPGTSAVLAFEGVEHCPQRGGRDVRILADAPPDLVVAGHRLDVCHCLGVGAAADRVLGVVDDVEVLTEMGDHRADERLDRPLALAHDRRRRAVDLELRRDPRAAG